MAKFPSDLSSLISYFKKLPGVGTKTAERFAFQILNWPDGQLSDFSELIRDIKIKVCHCPSCGCLMENTQCAFCGNPNRDLHTICIIASAKDAFAFEETRSYQGLYHVLGALLSPIDGRHPDLLQLEKLTKRIHELNIKEVIIALDSTLEGDTTSLYLKECFDALGLSVTRLAFGLPMGSSLDYVDGGTLMRALTGRQSF